MAALSGSPFRGMVIAPADVSEIVEPALRRSRRATVRLSRVTLKSMRLVHRRRIELMADYIVRRLSAIYRTTPYIPELHPFYRELASLLVDVDDLRRRLAKLKAATKVIRKIERDCLVMVRAAERRGDLMRARRAFLGRVLSVLEDLKEDLRAIREYQLRLLKVPDIDPELHTIVVAGPPNVGKSSFVRRVSTAEPEVREYPFTTKSLILGHVIIDDLYVQVIDTPGLLDRPLSERNEAELQAILALKHLAGVIVFLVDPSQTCGYDVQYQVRVYREVREHFSQTPILVCLNKVDVASREQVGAAKSLMEGDVIEMSVATGLNVDLVLARALRLLGVPDYYVAKLSASEQRSLSRRSSSS